MAVDSPVVASGHRTGYYRYPDCRKYIILQIYYYNYTTHFQYGVQPAKYP